MLLQLPTPPIVVICVFLTTAMILRVVAVMLQWRVAVPINRNMVLMLIITVLVSLVVTAPIPLATSWIAATTMTRGTDEAAAR